MYQDNSNHQMVYNYNTGQPLNIKAALQCILAIRINMCLKKKVSWSVWAQHSFTQISWYELELFHKLAVYLRKKVKGTF